MHLGLGITIASLLSLNLAHAKAEVRELQVKKLAAVEAQSQAAVGTRLKDFDRPATTLKEWEEKLENSKLISQNAPVTVTDVQVNRVDDGLDVVLEIEEGKPLSIDATNFRAEGTSLIADIPNAVLALPNAQEFSAENPSEEIANVRVTQLDASTIRVNVTGSKALPMSEVTLRTGALAYSLNPEEGDLDEEIVVTGEGQRGYFAPNSSTATKTDTPILEIPGSVQVVPRQVLNDQRVIRVGDAVQNVSGVSNLGQYQGYEDLIFLRGFQVSTFQGSFFRDGVRTFTFGSPDTTNLERIEVLKGPASILFGQVEPGGIINLVTKQPLRDPYYAAQLTIGNFDTHEGAVDLSGPLNDEKTILYRLNTSYRTAGSFRDFVDKQRFFLAPSLTFQLGSNTSLRLDAEYTDDSVGYDTGLVAIGDRPANIPIGRFLNEPFSNFSKEEFGVGYVFNHRFSDNWSVRNNFRYQKQRPERYGPQPDALDEVTGELLRSQYWAGGYYENFFTDTNVLGKFSTGSIAHQLLFGFEYSKTIEKPEFRFGFEYPSINIFNPVYARLRYPKDPIGYRDDTTSTVGIYVQDQIALLPNLKLLLGARYDTFKQNRVFEFQPDPRQEFEQSDGAVTPRFGIVYQPSETVSLYGSYSRSFRPSFAAARNGDNSAFEPETGEQFEVGVKAQVTPRLIATLAAYHLTKQNVTTADPNDPSGLFQIQTGEVTSKGIELDVLGEILPGWNIIASTAYIDARITQDNVLPVGNFLDNIPEWTASLWTTYEIQTGNLKGLGVGLGLYYVAARSGDLDNTFELPSYFRTDAALFYRRNNWKAQLNARNLFNVEHFTGSSFGDRLQVIPGAPFTISGTVSVEF
ncbi:MULTISPECIES: TonB-dependent siderophore receptor [Cyanophyceae]|uniref:TonB-dependent siderophore receptor n=1 Tax=Stenomitos frigidus AS-A4 TaxID=2933935 RepID=A0ABV0KHI4_9CYAN|nr:TonB-dependent siderophore receptor [Phormidium sp. FACHB-592]